MIKQVNRSKERQRRHLRVRKKISGTTARPRLCVFRSNRNISAQIIDDVHGVTLVSATSLDKELAGKEVESKVAMAKEVGKLIGERALEKDIKEVVFDRSGYKYHGRVAALADGAREAGLEF